LLDVVEAIGVGRVHDKQNEAHQEGMMAMKDAGIWGDDKETF
jgi:hypothetical protein